MLSDYKTPRLCPSQATASATATLSHASLIQNDLLPLVITMGLFEKWQRNAIFKAIQAAGLNPKEFDLDDSDARVQIKHKWSNSCFIVGEHYVGYRVVGDGPDWPYEVHSWEALLSRISTWASEVKHDLETPDLWAEMQREVKLLGAASDDLTGNTPFTLDEQKEIARRLHELSEHARTMYALSPAQMRVLDAKLDYLVEAAGRLGRIDWRNALAGAILGFVLTAAVPPEFVRDVLLTLLPAISHLYPLLPSG
jgi:hypothetical protein